MKYRNGVGGIPFVLWEHARSWRRLQTAAAQDSLTQVKDETGLHLALLDVFETLVHLVQLADLADHPGAPLGVQPEYLIEVRAGAHD